MNQYKIWQYLIIILIIIFGFIYALPNLFPQDYAVEITDRRDRTIGPDFLSSVKEKLANQKVLVKRERVTNKKITLVFHNAADRRSAANSISDMLNNDEKLVAYSLDSSSPRWLKKIGAKSMYLGLDLRGGVHFLMQVDFNEVAKQNLNRLLSEVKNALREEKIRYKSANISDDSISLLFRNASQREEASELIRSKISELIEIKASGEILILGINEENKKLALENALQQNLTTLRNRVNEFGVSEPVIQRQGASRIVVQLPGVEDTAQAKKIIGATATLQFRMLYADQNLVDPTATRAPIGTQLLKERNGNPVLLQKKTILTGEHIIDASSGLDQQSGSPAVFITLDGKGARIFSKETRERIGKPMAVVFIEQRSGRLFEEVINVATIRDQLSKRFQITGLDSTMEARTLALLLRAGSLAAPMEIIQERTIGPSLGVDNIRKGVKSVVVGMLAVLIFMAVYYRGFGLIANIALLVNLVLIVAVLSMLQATLTLPGIAGIVLTVGMAVDANVLIFQRIKEEIGNGNSPQMSIMSGYSKAFSTIADANITTLIAAIVLFSFGTGPIKGFAVTLSIGIITSMFTAISGTRAVVNLVFGRQRNLTFKI